MLQRHRISHNSEFLTTVNICNTLCCHCASAVTVCPVCDSDFNINCIIYMYIAEGSLIKPETQDVHVHSVLSDFSTRLFISSIMSSFSRRECFAILGLPEGSSQEEIKQAYHAKALDFHPDKNQNDPEATAKFQKISQAYQSLERGNFQRGSFFHDPYADSDSDSDNDSHVIHLSFLELFILIHNQMVREEKRREEMRLEAMMNNLFGYYRPHYYEDDFMHAEYAFGQRYQRAETQTTKDRSTEHNDQRTEDNNTRTRRSQHKTSQVHTPSRQSTRHKERSTGSAGPSSSFTSNYYSRPSEKSTRDFYSSERNNRRDQAASSPSGAAKQTYTSEQIPKEQKPQEALEKKAAPVYVVNQPKGMSKKQQLAQQRRRQREANEIGKELRIKAEKNAKLISEQKNALDDQLEA